MLKKTRKILLASLFILLGLLIVVIGVRSWFDGRAQERLGRAWAGLEKQGYLVSLRTLLPPLKKEDDNAARIWKAAEDLFLLDGNGRAALQRAEQGLREGKTPAPEISAAVEDLASRNRLTLDLIREAVKKPSFRYNIFRGLDYDRPWDLKLPDLAALAGAARLIRTMAALAAESGQMDQALDLWSLGTRLLLLMRGDLACLGSQYLIAGMKSQIPMLNRIVAGRKLEEKDLKALLEQLREEPWQEEFRHAIRYEASFHSQLYWWLLNDPQAFSGTGEPGAFRRWLFLPVLKTAAARTLENAEKDSRLALRPPWEIKDYAAFILGEFSRPLPRSLSLYFGSDGESLSEPSALIYFKYKLDILSAWLAAARLGIAGRIHFLRHGAYPAEIADLDKDILGVIPVDPYTGRDFIYKPGPDGFSVYSVGPNGRDESGRSGGSPRLASPPSADDDCVWTEIRPSPEKREGR